MTGAAAARDARDAMVARIDGLTALSQSEGFGVHTLFAGLYVQTNRRLLAFFDTLPDPVFPYLVMVRFHELFGRLVVQPALRGEAAVASQWLAYAALASRSTLTSPIGVHLRLISLGARAHVGHDLGEAIRLATLDHRRLFGRDPDFAAMRSVLLGGATSEAFFAATIDFNRMHRRRQRGWRQMVLTAHFCFAWISRPLMLGVLQSWRRAAWRDAMTALARPDEDLGQRRLNRAD